MTDTDFAAASAALIQARRSGQALAQVPAAWIPADLDEAYRLQHLVARGLGEVRGWKVSALTEAQQREIDVPCPVAAPLLAPWVQNSPAAFALAGFVTPKLECEFAFELGRDLPPRDQPYSRAEVEAAIAALHIVIEIVDSRLPAGSPTRLQLGDALNNGAFVVGPAVANWRTLDLQPGDRAAQTAAAKSLAATAWRCWTATRPVRWCCSPTTRRAGRAACSAATSSRPAAARRRSRCRGAARSRPTSARSASCGCGSIDARPRPVQPIFFSPLAKRRAFAT